MKSSLAFVLCALCSAFMVGCASGGSKTSKLDVKSQYPALPDSAYISTRGESTPAAHQCPSSDKSWRKENLVNLTKIANDCVRLRQYERVEQIGNSIAQKHHLTPWGSYYLSLAAEGKGEYTRALWMIELSINKSPKMGMLYYQKARVLWQLGEYSRAVESFNYAIKENPKFLDPHLFLAELYFRDQSFDLAQKHFLAVMTINPNHVGAVAGLAETKLIMGNAAAAAELYEQAVNMSPRTLAYRFKLAEIYEISQKDYAQALSTYKRIKTILSEQRYPAGDVPVNVNEKINRLELIINKSKSTDKKISDSSDKSKKKVRK